MPKKECCAAWEKLERDRRLTWHWQALHELCHSRVPFSRERYSQIAHLTQRDALGLLDTAREMGWWVASGGLHLGNLPRKR